VRKLADEEIETFLANRGGSSSRDDAVGSGGK
jgi:hypothetical protein